MAEIPTEDAFVPGQVTTANSRSRIIEGRQLHQVKRIQSVLESRRTYSPALRTRLGGCIIDDCMNTGSAATWQYVEWDFRKSVAFVPMWFRGRESKHVMLRCMAAHVKICLGSDKQSHPRSCL